MDKVKVTIAIPSDALDSLNNEHTGKTCSQITSNIKKACGGNMNNLGKTVHDSKCKVAKSAFNQGVKYATEQAKKQNIKTNVIYFTLGCVTVGTIAAVVYFIDNHKKCQKQQAIDNTTNQSDLEPSNTDTADNQ